MTKPSTIVLLAMLAAALWARLQIEPSFLEPLRGKNLACWCPLDQPCHADTLLNLANRRMVS